MTSVSQRFADLRARQACGLIPFITAGDPDLETTAMALEILDKNGADLIELGVPYADPLADGPVIQAAATRALQKGTRLDHVLGLVKELRPTLQAPLILFTYFNPIYHQGIRPFLTRVAAAGVQGLVIPDLPLEEADGVLALTIELGLELTLLVAPTTSPQRMAAIAQRSQGFIYLVSTTGVTGMRAEMQNRVGTLLSTLKSMTDKPIGVGFGISQPAQAMQVRDWGADAAIVGSAFVSRLAQADQRMALESLKQLCRELKAGLTGNMALTP